MLNLALIWIVAGCAVNKDEPDPKRASAPGNEIKPTFTADVAMKDVWDKEKTGPFRLAISPTGKYLLLMGHAKKANVQVWDLDKFERLHGFDDENGTMNMPIAVAPDGETGVYVGLRISQGIAVVSLKTGKILRVIKDKKDRFSSFTKGLHFSPKGDLLITAVDRDILTFDVKTGNPGVEWLDDAKVRALSNFFDDGKKIASVNENGNIHIWEVATGKKLQTLSDGDKRSTSSDALTFTNDGKIAVSRDYRFKIWDVPNGKVRHEISEPPAGHPGIRIMPGNRQVVWHTFRGFVIYDLETGKKKQEVTASDVMIYALTVKLDGKLIVTSDANSILKGWSVNANGVVE
jgi:WD40 repeat protein